ncbi:MAG TPA: YqgE/AlgH family protein [Candidatus Binataceae bacterium]|nr:YqgE/AlgH family protein [Candidatus Binataceae bacterium]
MLAGSSLMSARLFAAAAPNIASEPYFLVATPDLPDPIFQQSVILVLPSESPLVAGFIINKPTRVTVGEVFREVDGLKHPDDKAYFGGPVDYTEPILLMRSDHPPVGATRLASHLYAATGLGTIAAALTRPLASGDQRLMLGRAQWSSDQLHGEILQGAWETLPADIDLIFSAEPAKLWPKLVQQSHLRQVGVIAQPDPPAGSFGEFLRSP